MVEYKYNAWGNFKVLDANGNEITDETHIGYLNPFRYRGYYYSDDLGLYYLKSRFYDPEVGRFISADTVDYLAPDSINGLNLYAYCNNNPVMLCDPTGHSAILIYLLRAAVSGVVSFVANAVGQVLFEGATWETIQWKKVLIAGAAGFISALIPDGGFLSTLGQAFVSSLVENGLSAIWLGDEFKFGNVVKDTFISVTTSSVIDGLTHLTSKVTSKIFKKAPNYSQYQHYYRSKGYDYSRQEIYGIMKKHTKQKAIADETIKHSFEFLFSVGTYPL